MVSEYNLQELMLMKRELSNLESSNAPSEIIQFRFSQLNDKIEETIQKYEKNFIMILKTCSQDSMISKWTLPRKNEDNWMTLMNYIQVYDSWQSVYSLAQTCNSCGNKVVFQCKCRK